jgi:hypothetical protein
MNITLSVRPVSGVSSLPTTSSISVEAIYFRANVPGDSTPGASTQTVRLLLDNTLQGSIVFEDASSNQIQTNVLAVDGTLIFSRIVIADSTGNANLTLTQEEIDKCLNPAQAIPTDTTPLVFSRSVHLIPTSDIRIDYTRYTVLVSPLAKLETFSETGLDKLKVLNNKINSVEVGTQDLAPLTHIVWYPTHLAVDGTFTFSLIQQRSIGWLWWLKGDIQVLGFVPDDLSGRENQEIAVALPVLSDPNTRRSESGACDCNKQISPNVTEAELVNNPGIYSEDPGSFCKPFSNPERVLSEKSFSVISRVTQPEISAIGSEKTKTMRLLSLDDDERIVAPEPTTNLFSRLTSIFRASSNNPNISTIKPPLRLNLPAVYTNLVRSLSSGRATMSSNQPLQWEDDISQYQSTTVSLGNILEYRVRWRSNGYSLGTVSKTLTLAPRQTKRIQKIEWERRERARRREQTRLTDVENDSVTRQREYQDEVSANLSEWARGGSHSDTEAIAGGLGFFAEGIIGAIGGGAGSANSTSHQEGGRETNASEQQRLRDAIRRHGDALRKFESTVVDEVNQEETVTGTTEVIRNLNYAHSLTVIYYQILRHLKVNTEFAGVRQCLYIPFTVKAFDIHRAYRWRESIQSAIRSSRYLRALRYLKDVATNFSTSDIPPGTRAEQQITYLRGSIFVDLAIERPKDNGDAYDDARWSIVKPLLDTPALGIFSQLIAFDAAERDRLFQSNFAPGIAARWSNRLRLRINNNIVTVDSTLATRYQFNRGVRIDFVVPVEQTSGLRRSDLQNVTVLANDDLPPGSVANLTRMSLTYNTARFERSVQARTGVNDLINPVTGTRGLASILFPLDAWESVNERLEITRCVQDLVEHLNEHIEYYHKAIWWKMDRDRLMMMLDGFYIPGTNNVSIASVVDREPIGVIGNCLIYRVGAASFIEMGSIKTPAELYNLYAEKQPVRDPILVSLPTDGLYAQTIMDECVALEEHFGNLDWALNDKDPDLGTIDASLLTSRRADQSSSTAPTAFPSTIINLQNAPEAPAPSGLQGVLNAVTNPNAFRDMAGLAATQANALAALNTAANLATNFGNQAAALELAKMTKSQEATRTADQKLATIQRAKEKGLATDAEAASQAKEVLSSMNPDTPKGEAPHQNPAINSAIDNAKNIPGSTIEANTGEGAVKVKVGGDSSETEDSTGIFIIPNSTTGTAQNRAFNPNANSKTGKINLEVSIRNMPAGGTVRWSVPPAEIGHFTLAGGRRVQSGLKVEVTGLLPGLSNIDVEVLDSSGAVVQSEKYPLSIPQFVTVNIDAATFVPLLNTYGLIDVEIEEVMRNAKSVVDTVLNTANARTVWQMAPFGEALPAHLAVGAGLSNVTKATFRGDPPRPNLYGETKDRAGGGALVGPASFDETIDVYAGGFDDPVGAGPAAEVDDVTNQVVATIKAVGLASSAEKNKGVEVLGRLYGETLAHEIGHSIIGSTLTGGFHNAPAIDSDLMNQGNDRSFEKRSGFAVDPAQIGHVDLPTLLAIDNGIIFIDIPTTDSQTQINQNYPVPPAFR